MLILKTFICCTLFIECGYAAVGIADTDSMINGQGSNNFSYLVSGGQRVKSLTKYVVSIRTARPTAFFGDNHFCAGTIIASKLVLTAAHCIMDPKKVITRPRRLSVVAGTPNRLKQIHSSVMLTVQAVIPHPKYVRRGKNDIALLMLKTSVPFDNEYIKIIPLDNKRPPVGTVCKALGWGQLFFKGPFATDALYVELTVVENEFCKRSYPATYDDGVFCADDPTNSSRDTCRGDSGGPLICGEKLSGVISWGARCGRPGFPTAFTDVAYFRQWIQGINAGHRLTKCIPSILFTTILITNFS